ncbi:MAG: hypothetical protein Q9169_007371, partial [Polycauliona sp. 2 TL-2023]
MKRPISPTTPNYQFSFSPGNPRTPKYRDSSPQGVPITFHATPLDIALTPQQRNFVIMQKLIYRKDPDAIADAVNWIWRLEGIHLSAQNVCGILVEAERQSR